MRHALIVEQDLAIGDALEDALAKLGFRSFERTWTEAAAIAAADRRAPDLVLVGSLAQGSPARTAERIGRDLDAPVILARRKGEIGGLPGHCAAVGPFAPARLRDALAEIAAPSLA